MCPVRKLLPVLIATFTWATLHASSGNASLAETVAWLNEKFAQPNEIRSTETTGSGVHMTYFGATSVRANEQCYLAVSTRTRTTAGSQSGPVVDIQSTLKLSNVRPTSTEIQEQTWGERKVSVLVIETSPDGVTSDMQLDSKRGEPIKTNKVLLFLADRDFAERVARAMNHSALLCGAKEEPF